MEDLEPSVEGQLPKLDDTPLGLASLLDHERHILANPQLLWRFVEVEDLVAAFNNYV
jgi:hypothetical protein